MNKTEKFIEKANYKHNFKYDYSLVIYTHINTKVIIVCLEHGEFEQRPSNHTNGQGCPFCAKIKRNEYYSFISENNRIWHTEQPKDYKLIPLTKGKYTKVDNEDFDKLKNINWLFICCGDGYAYNKKIGFLHRYITNCPNDMLVDHENHDTLDNRKHNLRICSKHENSMNRQIQKSKKSSIYKGVYLFKRDNKWLANIKYMNENYHLGTFINEKDAAEAYNNKAKELYGEFAKLNNL